MNKIASNAQLGHLELLLITVELLATCRADGGIVGLPLSAIIRAKLLRIVGVHLFLGDHHSFSVYCQNDSPNEVDDHVKQGKSGVSLVGVSRY